MKKYWPYIIAGVVAILIIGGVVFKITNSSDKTQNSNKNNTNTASVITLDIGRSICDQIPNSVIEEALNKNIVKTEQILNSSSNVCQYYIDAIHFVTLRLNNLSYENQKNGQIALDRQITTNPQINAEHFVAVQEDGLINDIVLKINDNLFLAVDRSSGSSASETEIVTLAAKVSNYLNNGSPQSNNSQADSQVPTQDDEGFINNFFRLIEDKQASDAVMLMTNQNTSNDSTKQAWGVQFNNMASVKVVSITPEQQSSWTETKHEYKVVLDVVMDPNSADAPIPYYGYENGQNTRYVTLVKEDETWRIDSIATSP